MPASNRIHLHLFTISDLCASGSVLQQVAQPLDRITTRVHFLSNIFLDFYLFSTDPYYNGWSGRFSFSSCFLFPLSHGHTFTLTQPILFQYYRTKNEFNKVPSNCLDSPPSTSQSRIHAPCASCDLTSKHARCFIQDPLPTPQHSLIPRSCSDVVFYSSALPFPILVPACGIAPGSISTFRT